jgi:sugar transferase EpsL
VVVPPNAPEPFADALIQMAEDGHGRQVMGRHARSLAEAVFDRKKLVRETADLIESVHACHQTAGPSGEGRLFYRFFKRSLDLTVALVGLTLLSPILLGISLAVRARLGSPVLFRQVRPGYQGKAITVYKFRTMHDIRDVHGTLLPDAERLTPLGNWLRRFSLDELPQLFNVLKGGMSLVGPRPLLMEYVPLYDGEQIRRHEVKPGITGWAQVNGRNAVRWEDQFALDVWYVNHRTLRLDVKILGMTVLKTIRSEGIRQENHATRERFRGSTS